MPAHSSILAWRISWTEESDPLQSIGLWIVEHYWSDLARQPGLVVFSPLTISVKKPLFHKIDDIIWSNSVQLTLSEQRKFRQPHLILSLPFFMTACNQGVALARSLTVSDVGGHSSEPAFLKKAAQRFVSGGCYGRTSERTVPAAALVERREILCGVRGQAELDLGCRGWLGWEERHN